jgi:hypothetical protein
MILCIISPASVRKVKVKIPATPCMGQEEEKMQLLLVLDLGIRWGWLVSVTPRPRYTPGKGPPVPIVQEAGWAPESVWTQRLEKKSSCHCRGSNLHRPVGQYIGRHYTDSVRKVKVKLPATPCRRREGEKIAFIRSWSRSWMGVTGQYRTPAALYPAERIPVHIGHEAVSASDLVWTQRLEEKSFAYAGDRTPVFKSVVRRCTNRSTSAPVRDD